MDTPTPVVPGLEKYEIQLGGPEVGQPEYQGLPALRSPDGRVLTRWTFTKEERAAIANGADLFTTCLTLNHPFQPIMVTVGLPETTVTKLKRNMRLDEELELRTLLYDARNAQALLEKRQLEILNASDELKTLAEKAQRVRTLLEQKKQQVFSPEKKPDLVLVQ